MIKALIYKEWKKMKWFYLAISLLGLALLTYIFLRTGRSFRMVGIGHIWDVITNRDQMIFRDLRYFPLLAGIVLGAAQFVPEMIQKRIKLSLHLPLKESKVVIYMLGFGQALMLSIFLVHLIALIIFNSIYFTNGILLSTIQTIIPWYLAGIIAHAFAAMICLEPTWRSRVINLLFMLACVKLCHLSDAPAAYGYLLLAFIPYVFYIWPFSFYSVYRFKNGEQD